MNFAWGYYDERTKKVWWSSTYVELHPVLRCDPEWDTVHGPVLQGWTVLQWMQPNLKSWRELEVSFQFSPRGLLGWNELENAALLRTKLRSVTSCSQNFFRWSMARIPKDPRPVLYPSLVRACVLSQTLVEPAARNLAEE